MISSTVASFSKSINFVRRHETNNYISLKVRQWDGNGTGKIRLILVFLFFLQTELLVCICLKSCDTNRRKNTEWNAKF